MANTTSFRKRRPNRGAGSFVPAPEMLRPLKYKTALRLAFERAMVRDLGVDPAVAAKAGGGGIILTSTWRGSRASA